MLSSGSLSLASVKVTCSVRLLEELELSMIAALVARSIMYIRRLEWVRLRRKNRQYGHQLLRADPSAGSHCKQKIVAQAMVVQIFLSVLLTGMPIHSRSVALVGADE